MTIEIKVPQLGESVTEASVARWLKNEGDLVTLDETLVELETDKVTLEVSATASGVLTSIAAEKGSIVTIGALLGKIEISADMNCEVSATSKDATVITAPTDLHMETGQVLTDQGLSPSVRKLMEENNILPSSIAGTGPEGRISKGDVLNYLQEVSLSAQKKKTTAPTSFPATKSPSLIPYTNGNIPAQGDRQEERAPMSRLRRRIAERLKEAQNTAAILTTFNEVDMSKVMDLRSRLKDQFEKKHRVKLGFMSFFVKACTVALKEFPAVNARIDGEEIIYHNYCDIGVAVGTPQGLVVPIIRNAEQMGFSQIESKINDFGVRARDGKLGLDEMMGGTFTISNGGVYGSLMSTPILNPPQSAILGMHKIQERPIAIDGRIEIRPMMYLALSYDHRIIDGKEAVTFLIRIKECLEDPERILLDT